MVGVTKIQRGNANYWIEAVAAGAEDYYTKPGESPGRWLARRPRLSASAARSTATPTLLPSPARIRPAASRLVNRPAPRTFTDAAGRQRRAEPVLGFDVRFAAPKSVSLLYALGSPEVRAAATRAHDVAVAEAISYLEQNACFVGRGKGGARVERGGGFLAMAFRHRSSRAGDPALHTHVLVANLTRAASDGRWLSLASPRRRSPLFHHAKPAGYVYQAALRAAITRELGLEWRPVQNGYADLTAVERPVIEHFSRRRAEIVESLATTGHDSPRAAEVAAYRTRDRKDYGVDADTRARRVGRAGCGVRPRRRFAGHPPGGEQRPRAEPRSARPRSRPRSPNSSPTAPTSTAAICSARSPTNSRRGPGRTSSRSSVEELLASERLIEIHAASSPIDPALFTTPRLQALEQSFTAPLSGARAPPPRSSTRTRSLRSLSATATSAPIRSRWSAGSPPAASGSCRWPPRPGTGKTTALAAAREAWEADGRDGDRGCRRAHRVGRAADAGIPSTSITALLIRAEEWGAGTSPSSRRAP